MISDLSPMSTYQIDQPCQLHGRVRLSRPPKSHGALIWLQSQVSNLQLHLVQLKQACNRNMIL
uniref:Uncharacterized protein n=1 Tax=Arundo donax TaxID=35708 RepID=A0A0A9ECJ8_ARUDO